MQQQTTRRNDTPLVKGDAMLDNSIIVAACALLALLVAAFTASVVVAGWACGMLVVAGGCALYCVGKSDGREQA